MALAHREATVVWEGTLGGGQGAVAGDGSLGGTTVDWAATDDAAGDTTSPEQLLAAAEDAVREVLSRRPDAGAVLVFSCLARQQLLGARVGEESARMQAAAGDVPVFGVYTLGEFGRTTGVLGFHNASVSAVAL